VSPVPSRGSLVDGATTLPLTALASGLLQAPPAGPTVAPTRGLSVTVMVAPWVGARRMFDGTDIEAVNVVGEEITRVVSAAPMAATALASWPFPVFG
jgi:hypothetical protein